MEIESYFWLAAAVIFLIIEAATVGLTSIWLAVGSMAAMFVSVIGLNGWWQVIVFLIVSFILLFLTRPFAMKHINAKHEKTNSDKMIGTVVKVTQKIDNNAQTGAVLANGVEWTARAVSPEETYEFGELVEVKSISGVKLMISRYKED